MNLQTAYRVFQINESNDLTNEFIKKRYRQIAAIIHPDKFTEPLKKLNATKQFIELQNAYEFLIKQNYSDRYLENSKKPSFEEKDNEYINKEVPYKQNKESIHWTFYLLIPGALIGGFFVSISLITGFMVEKVFFDKSDWLLIKIIKFLLIGFTFLLPIILIMYFGLKIFLEKTIYTDNIFLKILFIQILIYFIYLTFVTIKTKMLNKKINNQLITEF